MVLKIIIILVSTIFFSNLEAKTKIDSNYKLNILNYNYKIIKERNDLEINKIKMDYTNKLNINLKNISEDKKIYLDKYKNLLNEIIKNNKSLEVISESYYRLAIINMEEYNYSEVKNNFKYIDESIKLLKKQPRPAEGGELFPMLNIKINLYTAQLYFLKENYLESKKYYNKVINLINKNGFNEIYSKENILSLLGLGDCDYFISNFSDSYKNYKNAKKIIDNRKNALPENNLSFESILNIRAALSAYRDGDYINCLREIKLYSYQRNLYTKYININLEKELINLGSISLFELKDPKLFKQFSSDKTIGDFGKEIILGTYSLFRKSGQLDFMNLVSKKMKPEFYNSKNYYLFFKNWIEMNNNNYNDDYYKICYSSIMEIFKKSIWRQKFLLNKEEDDIRKSIVSKYFEKTAEYFYNKALRSQKSKYFLMAADLYNAKIEEIDSDSKIVLLIQKYSNSLYMAKEYKKAYNSIEKSFKYQTSIEDLKSGLFLKLKITRMLSASATDPEDLNFKNYEIAIDDFFNKFSDEKFSRAGLFESAKRSESLLDFKSAKLKYIKLLNYVYKNKTDIDLEEKNNILINFSYILNKIKNDEEENVQYSTQIDNYAYEFGVNKSVKKIVSTINFELANKYYYLLNKSGKLNEAGKFLLKWSNENYNNPNASSLYIEAIKLYSQLQYWKQSLKLCLNFKKLFPKDKMYFESLYWQAIAHENLLLFNIAANEYEKSASSDYLFPLINDKLKSFDKSMNLFRSLNMPIDEARVINKKSDLLMKHKIENNTRIAMDKLQAARIYFKLKKFEDFDKVYFSYKNLSKVEKNIVAQFDLYYYISLLYRNKYKINSVDKLLNKFLTNKSNINLSSISDFVYFLNEYDENNFFIIQKYKINSINRLIDRSKYLKKYLVDKNILYNTYVLISKLNNELSKSYENMSIKDNFILSQKYMNESRKYIADTIINSSFSEEEKLKLYMSSENNLTSKNNFRTQFIYEDKNFYDKIFKIMNDEYILDSIKNFQLKKYQLVIDKLKLYIAEKKIKYVKLMPDIFLNDYKEAYLLLAISYMESGDENHAWPIFNELIQKLEPWEPIYLVFFEIFNSKKSYNLSKTIALKALDRLKTPSPLSYINLARVESSLKNNKNAEKILMDSQLIFAEKALSLGWLGVLHLKQNNIIDACKKFAQAYSIDSKNEFVVYNHLACLIESHQYSETNSILQVILQDPNSDFGFYYLGGVLQSKLGKNLEAQKYWDNYLKLADKDDFRQLFVEASLSSLNPHR